MKKLLSVLLGAAMVLSLAACGTADDTTTDNNTATDDATTTTYKVGIVNYVDDPSLAQIQAAVEAELDAKGQELFLCGLYLQCPGRPVQSERHCGGSDER